MLSLEQAIELIEQTGDKCLVLRQNGSALMVMKVEQYCKLLAIKADTPSNNSLFGKPTTDLKVYEVPKRQSHEDIYYPEPLK